MVASVIFIAISFSSAAINIDFYFVLLLFFTLCLNVTYHRFACVFAFEKLPVLYKHFLLMIQFKSYKVIFKLVSSLGIGTTNGGKRKASERKGSESINHIKKVR